MPLIAFANALSPFQASPLRPANGASVQRCSRYNVIGYWGSFHSCVRSRTGVNAESKRVKMRFAGVILRNKCVFDSSLAFFDFWIAIPRRQRNCYRGCTASTSIFKAKKKNSQWQNRHWIAQKTIYQILITPPNKFISCAS